MLMKIGHGMKLKAIVRNSLRKKMKNMKSFQEMEVRKNDFNLT